MGAPRQRRLRPQRRPLALALVLAVAAAAAFVAMLLALLPVLPGVDAFVPFTGPRPLPAARHRISSAGAAAGRGPLRRVPALPRPLSCAASRAGSDENDYDKAAAAPPPAAAMSKGKKGPVGVDRREAVGRGALLVALCTCVLM